MTRTYPVPHRVGGNRKTFLTIDERAPKITRNSVFDCHLSPVGRQMAIENSVSNDFLSTFVDSIKVFDCLLFGVRKQYTFRFPKRVRVRVCMRACFVNVFYIYNLYISRASK